MKNTMPQYKALTTKIKLRQTAAMFFLLLSVPMAVQALSLGRSRGAVLLGQPLNVLVLASVEPQEETPEPACFSAEVFYGDNRLSPQNVALSVTRSSPTELNLRVRGSSVVDEPVVTVYLKSGCGQSSSRRYVLLPDAPTEAVVAGFSPPIVLPLGPRATPPNQAAPKTLGTAETSGARSPAATRRAERKQERMLKAESLRAQRALQKSADKGADGEAVKPQTILQPPAGSPKQAKSRAVESVVLPSKGRLKLDLLDLTSPLETNLRASAELLTQPSQDAAVRAQAALAWKIINAQPEDVLRDAQRLQTIETDLRTISDTSKKQTQELNSLKSDLAQAQQQRYANPLVYALGALAMGALALAFYLYRRNKRLSSPWWGSVAKFDQSADSRYGDSASPVSMQTASGGLQVDGTTSKRKASSGVDISETARSNTRASHGTTQPLPAYLTPPSRLTADAEESSNRHRTSETVNNRAAPWRDAPMSGFGSGLPGAPRAVNAEELFDIQQQADFFLSLGQHAQAIDILKNHITENVETSALAYLDLFSIYHQVGQREEFEDLRRDFNMVFNAQVPQFDDYGQSSRGLEDYESALSRIQSLWPQPQVLQVIEESIFRKPDHDDQPFDLAAYRELMLLYAMAKDITALSDVTDAGNPGADLTHLQPLSSAPFANSANREIDVDIDLDIFGGDAVEKPQAVLPQAAGNANTNTNIGSIDFDAATASEFGKFKFK